MWSGRTLVVLSLASVAAALFATVVAGWTYGLGLYAASVVAFCLLLRHMIRQQRGQHGKPRRGATTEAGGKVTGPSGMIRPRS
jgi:membrane protein implicated in regulation of membrane protease activity